MYGETNESCGSQYDNKDLGAPPSADYAYYITVLSSSKRANDCGGYSYIYYVRVGAYTNPVKFSGEMSGVSGVPIANTELEWPATASAPPANTDYFGVSSSLGSDASHGLHIQKLGSWQLWTTGNDSSVYSASGQYVFYKGIVSFYSFSTHK